MALPGLTRAQGDKRYLTSSAGWGNGMLPAPIVAGRVFRPGSFVNLSGYTWQRIYRMYVNTTQVRFVYQNWGCIGATPGNENSAGPFTLQAAAIFGWGATPVAIPITFSGVQSITVGQYQTVVSDPVELPSNIVTGSYFLVRSYTTVGGTYLPVGIDPAFPNSALINGWGEGYITGAGLDTTTSFDVIARLPSGKFSFGPVAVIGWPTSGKPTTVVAQSGDSVVGGTDWSSNEGPGLSFTNYALDNASIPSFNLGRSGENASDVIIVSNYFRRFGLVRGCTKVIDEYGTNDIAGGATAATVKASLLQHWNNLAARGVTAIYRTTITPRNTSSNGWSTLAGQTLQSFESVRQTINQWLRAPASAGAGNSARFDSGGLVAAIFDTAALIEVNSDGSVPTISPTTGALVGGTGGYWFVDTTAYDSGTLTSSTTGTLTDTTKTWTITPAHQYLGSMVVITADATTPSSVGSFGFIAGGTANSLTLGLNWGVQPSAGASYKIYHGVVDDGTHPNKRGHIRIAAAIDTTKLT